MAELVTLDSALLDSAYSVHCSCQSFPWSRHSFGASFSEPYFARALIDNGQVVGYFLCHQVLDEITLMDIGLSPSARGKGFGTLMLNEVLALSRARDAHCIFLEVRVSNQVAIHLYQQAGFNTIDIRKDYYACVDGREDARVMQLLLSGEDGDNLLA